MAKAITAAAVPGIVSRVWSACRIAQQRVLVGCKRIKRIRLQPGGVDGGHEEEEKKSASRDEFQI